MQSQFVCTTLPMCRLLQAEQSCYHIIHAEPFAGRSTVGTRNYDMFDTSTLVDGCSCKALEGLHRKHVHIIVDMQGSERCDRAQTTDAHPSFAWISIVKHMQVCMPISWAQLWPAQNPCTHVLVLRIQTHGQVDTQTLAGIHCMYLHIHTS